MRRRQSSRRCPAATAALAVVLAMTLQRPAPAAAPAPAAPSEPGAAAKDTAGGSDVGEAISIQRAARKQWLELIQTMLQVAKELEKSEPESARVIAAAAQKAQEALIADDMAKVIQFLEDGMVVPADATQAGVIRKLRAVLEALRGGDMRLRDRLDRIAEWKQHLKDLDNNLGRQRVLEDHSRQVAFGDKEAKDLEDLARQVRDLAEREREIRKATEGIAADPNVRKLVEAREAVRAVARKQAALSKVTASAAAGQLALAAEAQDALRGEAGKTGEHLERLAKDADLAKTMKDAGVDPNAAEVAAGQARQAADEMQQASAAIAKWDAAGAATAQSTSDDHLRDAERALTDAIDKMSGGQKAGQLAGEQRDLKGKADQVAAAVEKAGAAPEGSPNQVAQAAEHMGKAAEHLQEQNKPQALDREQKAIDALEAQAKQLDKQAASLKETAGKPEHAEQKGRQDNLAKDTRALAERMQGGKPSADGEAGQEAAPGQPSVQQAAENQQQAGSQLGQPSAAAANQSQNQAIKNLEKARDELNEAIAKEQREAQQQALAQIEAALRKVLEAQKRLSAGTKDVHGKARPDGSFERAESVRLADLAGGEGKLAEETAGVARLLEDEGTTVVFPSVLGEVREDMTKSQELLASEQPGPLVQGIQKEIEERLEEMIEALQMELANRQDQADQGESDPNQRQPLVSPLAELKMLRALQAHINQRTLLLDKTRQAGQAPKDVIEVQHKVLSDRQDKVGKMTRDLAETLKAQPH